MPITPNLICDRCRTVLTGAVVNTPEPVACPGCHAPLLARVFPAFFGQKTEARPAESVLSDEDASCFYHPRKKAVVPCSQCGRFLCALCDLELAGRHLCPGCVEAGRRAGGKGGAPVGLPPSQRLLYDKVALSLAVLPLIVFFLTLVTAPVVLYLVVRHWNDPRRSPIPRGRWRLVVAGVFALLELAGWAYLISFQFFHLNVFMNGSSSFH